MTWADSGLEILQFPYFLAQVFYNSWKWSEGAVLRRPPALPLTADQKKIGHAFQTSVHPLLNYCAFKQRQHLRNLSQPKSPEWGDTNLLVKPLSLPSLRAGPIVPSSQLVCLSPAQCTKLLLCSAPHWEPYHVNEIIFHHIVYCRKSFISPHSKRQWMQKRWTLGVIVTQQMK